VIAVVDNYDSFTHGLVQCLGMLGAGVEVVRNDAATVDELQSREPEGVIVSSGAGPTAGAGISSETIRRFTGRAPVLGVSLGHEALVEAFGGRTVPSPRPMHGRVSPVLHRGYGLFAGLDNPFEATRYHALVADRASLPDELEIVAWTPEGEIMGVKHRGHETWGVQFHPESVLTRPGLKLIENFLTLCRQQRRTSR
jgi:anthranilate synthase/aminodeoxychorismate synthase-like glutamine amidotransferase